MRVAPPARILPCAPDQMFALAADIERYPEFLTGWRRARIIAREGNRWRVQQALGLGPLQLEFESQARLEPPRSIEVASDSAPFATFRFTWLIEALEIPGARVSLAAEITMRSRLAQHAVDALLPAAMADVLQSFEVRARHLYGPVQRPI